jgi:hypothetical protein
MTFAPKYVPYREALRIVAERVGLKEGRANPLDLALAEDAILYEFCDAYRRGWKQAAPGCWNYPDFIYRGPPEARPPLEEGGGGHSLADEVRFSMIELNRLWPSATVGVTSLAMPPDDEDYIFARLLIEAIEHFKSTGKGPSQRTKKEVKQYFLDLKRLPDGRLITGHMAEKLATFCRSPRAMEGGNPKSKRG